MTILQNEKKKLDDKTENRTTKKIEHDPNEILKLTENQPEVLPVHKNCLVCESGHVDEIHRLRPYYKLDDITKIIEDKYKIHLSKSVLSYHFNKYYKAVENISHQKLYEQFNADVDILTDHRKKILFLTSVGFESLMKQLDEGRLFFGVKEFSELVKLYHTVLKNPDAGSNNNLIAIFQKMSDQYNVNLDQGTLFSNSETDKKNKGGSGACPR